MSTPADGRRKVFVSYSHNDSDWLKRIQIHLKPLERDDLVELWDDTRIQTGARWRKEISDALNSASAAVLLISADFIASDFIANNELPPLLAAAENDGVVILPLILSPSRFEKMESLARYQSVNPPSKPLIKLSRAEQEEYLVKLSDDVLRAVEEVQTKPARAGGAGHPRIFNVPFPQNKFFTGRDDILGRLHSGFADGETAQALNGLGGIGKTQTAVEYAYRHRQDYKTVLWCKAYSREVIVCDFAAIAVLLNLCEKDEKDQSLIAAAAKRWLEANDGWLLILDNADDLAMAREFIPSCETGHVLLTTRAQNTKPIAVRQVVERMEPREGALFLLHRLEKIKKGEPLESAPEELRKQAEALSKAVDGLPLALDQAAAFIEETPSTFEEYQTLYQSERKELLKRRGRLAEDHPSVTVTFSLAFKKVVDANPAAADLLRVCAFLEADSIPEEIFSEGAQELGEALGSAAESSLALTDAIGEAARFSLLRRHPEARTVSLHRLAQAVLRDEMDSDTRRMWAERAVRALNEVFPEVVKYEAWPFCSRLISHAQSLAALIDEHGFEFPEAARLMYEAGYYLTERAQYAEAEPLYQRSLGIYEKAFGHEHPSTARSLHHLAYLYQMQERYAEAEPLYQRALGIYEKALGHEHPSTAQILNNLAFLCQLQERYAEAELLLKRALDISERARSPISPSTVMSLNNLAHLYDRQGRYAEAEPLLKRALDISEKALGAEHPSTAVSLGGLAYLYQLQKRYAEAEPLYQRALGIYEKALGAEHPETAHILHDLASLYREQGRYAEAEPHYQRALNIKEKALGLKHPSTAMSLNGLALLYQVQGRYADAEPLFKRALDIREKALGREHSHTVIVLGNYAALLRALGREAEADELEARGGAYERFGVWD